MPQDPHEGRGARRVGGNGLQAPPRRSASVGEAVGAALGADALRTRSRRRTRRGVRSRLPAAGSGTKVDEEAVEGGVCERRGDELDAKLLDAVVVAPGYLQRAARISEALMEVGTGKSMPFRERGGTGRR
jgi:hypothetical protein